MASTTAATIDEYILGSSGSGGAAATLTVTLSEATGGATPGQMLVVIVAYDDPGNEGYGYNFGFLDDVGDTYDNSFFDRWYEWNVNSYEYAGEFGHLILWKLARGGETELTITWEGDARQATYMSYVFSGCSPAGFDYGYQTGSDSTPGYPYDWYHDDGAHHNYFNHTVIISNKAQTGSGDAPWEITAGSDFYDSHDSITGLDADCPTIGTSIEWRYGANLGGYPSPFEVNSGAYTGSPHIGIMWGPSPLVRIRPGDLDQRFDEFDPDGQVGDHGPTLGTPKIYEINKFVCRSIKSGYPTLPRIALRSGICEPNDLEGDQGTLGTPTITPVNLLSPADLTSGYPTFSGVSAIESGSAADGPFYFAWVEPTETTFGVVHHRTDENIFAFDLSHLENDFATLNIDVVNPRVGLLNSGRKRWAWLGYKDSGGTVHALFFGRLVGVPQELQNEVVRLEFVARPQGYEGTKAALANTMRSLPYYDPMWYSPDARETPDIVLEGRPELWHIDRVTHDVTSTNILVGEDGTIDLGTNHFYDSLSVTYAESPGRTANVTVNVAWRQVALGQINITSQFPKRIESLTWAGLIADWPKAGDDIGGGWSVFNSDGVRVDSGYGTYTYKQISDYNVTPATIGTFDTEQAIADLADGNQVMWDIGIIKPYMIVQYDTERDYAEQASFTMTADVQPLLTEPGEEEVLQISMSANADDPIDDAGNTPIGALDSRSFFHQDRGRQALEHVMCVARAQLMARARAIDIVCQTDFESGLALSCRKNLSLDDGRLPGGTASGKIKGYNLTLNGDTGEAVATINVGATIGNGGSVGDATGTPTYVDAGYAEEGWQRYSDAATALATADTALADFSDQQPNDDGIVFANLKPSDVVVSVTVFDEADAQQAFIASGGNLTAGDTTYFNSFQRYQSDQEASQQVNEVYTEILLDMIDLTEGGPFESEYTLTVSDLKLPKTIDLEAS